MRTLPAGGARDELSAERIEAGLDTSLIGQRVVYLPQVTSTNDEAQRLARMGAPEGTLVITDHQTAGRGRLDRRWEAPPGSSLLMTLVFRPELAPHQVQRLTMVCGLAMVDAIGAEAGLSAALKWPNDVVLAEAKVGGILTEIDLHGEQVAHVVIGMGLNVNLDPAQLPGDLLAPATSIAHILGRPIPRLPLLWALLKAIEERYLRLKAGHSPHSEWTEHLVTLGRRVEVSSQGVVLDGLAEGVDEDGGLLVRLADGRLETVVAGDVTLQPPAQLKHT